MPKSRAALIYERKPIYQNETQFSSVTIHHHCINMVAGVSHADKGHQESFGFSTSLALALPTHMRRPMGGLGGKLVKQPMDSQDFITQNQHGNESSDI
jgi:hypothetical protein